MATATLPLTQPRLFYGRDYYPKIKTIDSFATLQPIRADGYDNVTLSNRWSMSEANASTGCHRLSPPHRWTMLMLLLSTGDTRLCLAYPRLNEGLPLSGAGCDPRIITAMTQSR